VSGPVLFMNRATEMAPGLCARNRHRLFPPRNWQPSPCIALLALSGTCRYHTRNEAGIGADTAHAWGAQSHLMRWTDEHHYEVPNNPPHPRVLVNETLGTRLAQRLGPPPTPVEMISQGMLVFDKWTCSSNGRQTLFRRTQDFVETAKQKPGKTHQAFIFFHIKLNTDN